MACVGRTCATHRPSPSCGRRSVVGSPTRPSSPPTTRRSTGASCTPAVRGTAFDRRGRGSCARWNSLGRSGESGRRNCRTSAAGSGSRCVTTMPERTRWRARASCSRPKPKAGGPGSAEYAGRRAAPSYVSHRPPPGHGGRTGCTGSPSNTRCSRGGGDYSAPSQHVGAGTDTPARLAAARGASGSPTAELRGEPRERVVRSQAILHTAREGRLGRRASLRTRLRQLDPQLEAAGFDTALRGLESRPGLARLVPRDGRLRRAGTTRHIGLRQPRPLPRLPDQNAQRRSHSARYLIQYAPASVPSPVGVQQARDAR